MRRRLPTLLAVVLIACGGAGSLEGPEVTATGPPEIDFALVRRHAQQFDVDLPSRPPGSQQELAAATYILGHLQLAGYAPLLDAVPVRDQVHSSNVIAVPPSGAEPKVVVTVAYDTSGQGLHTGTEIGLFLELARALNIAVPDHAVGFAALGAEGADGRGSAALLGFFEEQGLEPSVISVRTGARGGESLYAQGSCTTTDFQLMAFEDCSDNAQSDATFSPRRFQFTRVEGDPEVMGGTLFEFLLGVPD